jgi:hypothetical protein
MKRKTLSSSLVLFVCAAAFISGCSSVNPVTDSLFVDYGAITITTEKVGKETNLNANINVILKNRTERGMNIGFLDCTLLDAVTNQALIRFRPIIPDAYGSISTVQLIPNEKKEVPVVMPQGMSAFDVSASPKVLVKISLQTTDGYRTDAVSGPVVVGAK